MRPKSANSFKTSVVFSSPYFRKAFLVFFWISFEMRRLSPYELQFLRSWINTWISSDAIQNGGSLQFEMSDIPNKNWATDKTSVPYSLSLEN